MTYSELYVLRIRQLCQNRNITINKLAFLAGLKQSTVDNIIAVPVKTRRSAHSIKLQMYLLSILRSGN